MAGSRSGSLASLCGLEPRASGLLGAFPFPSLPPLPSRLLSLTPLTSKAPLTLGQGLRESHLLPLRPKARAREGSL